jgi:hypothetical protein
MINLIISAYALYKTLETTYKVINNTIYVVNVIRASKIARKYL